MTKDHWSHSRPALPEPGPLLRRRGLHHQREGDGGGEHREAARQGIPLHVGPSRSAGRGRLGARRSNVAWTTSCCHLPRSLSCSGASAAQEEARGRLQVLEAGLHRLAGAQHKSFLWQRAVPPPPSRPLRAGSISEVAPRRRCCARERSSPPSPRSARNTAAHGLGGAASAFAAPPAPDTPPRPDHRPASHCPFAKG